MEHNTTNPSSKPRISPAIITVIVIVLIAAAAGTVYAIGRTDDQTSDTTQTSQSAETTESEADGSQDTDSQTSDATSSYKNGEYTETGKYSTPGGQESVTVTATLENGIITDISTTGSASGGNSKQYQSQFLGNYEDLVVGKSIDEVKLSRVAGSSLTSGGFNEAIEAIKTDAQS